MKILISKLVEAEVIEKDEADIYEYGLECLLLKAVHYSSYFIIALLLNKVAEWCLFMLFFGALRKNAGGFHAKTRFVCYVWSCAVVGLFLFTVSYELNICVMLGLLIFANLVIYFLAPVNGENMDLNVTEQKFYQKRSRIILLSWNVLCVICVLCGVEYVARVIIESCALEAIILLLAILEQVGKREKRLCL